MFPSLLAVVAAVGCPATYTEKSTKLRMNATVLSDVPAIEVAFGRFFRVHPMMPRMNAGRVKNHARNATGAINAIPNPTTAKITATNPSGFDGRGAKGGGVAALLDMATCYTEPPC